MECFMTSCGMYYYIYIKKTKIQMSLFHAVMENGVISVPPYESPEVLKGGAIHAEGAV